MSPDAYQRHLERCRIRQRMKRAAIQDERIRLGIPDGRAGRKMPSSPCRRNESNIRQWHTEGVTSPEMARRVGVRGYNMLRFLAKLGLKPNPTDYKGKGNPAWRGGRRMDKAGYVLVHSPGHPHRDNKQMVREHRLVMESHLGRYLKPREVVDHINGNTADNRLENLLLFACNAEHLRYTLRGKCPQWTAEGKERIRQALKARWAAMRQQRKTYVGDVLPPTDRPPTQPEGGSPVGS